MTKRYFAFTLVSLCIFGFAAPGMAQTLTTLANFTFQSGTPAATPLARSSDGNFYGSVWGGSGSIYRVTPAGVISKFIHFAPREAGVRMARPRSPA
jgi:hypothetical protein